MKSFYLFILKSKLIFFQICTVTKDYLEKKDQEIVSIGFGLMVTRWRKAGDECDKAGGKLSEDQTSSWFG